MDRCLKLEVHGSNITLSAGLRSFRERDEVLVLFAMSEFHAFLEAARFKNIIRPVAFLQQRVAPAPEILPGKLVKIGQRVLQRFHGKAQCFPRPARDPALPPGSTVPEPYSRPELIVPGLMVSGTMIGGMGF